MVLLITYDLHNPGRDYAAISNAIQTARSFIHPQGSVWIVDTDLTPADWRAKLKQAGDPNDEYFIARLQGNWASFNMGDAANWLNSSSRNW